MWRVAKSMGFTISIYCLLVCWVIGSFEPYSDNGGTTIGIAGRGYCIIASDTRLSESYSIRSRNISKIFQLDEKLLLAASGCHADCFELSRILQYLSREFYFSNNLKLTVEKYAHLLSVVLYSRRHMPFFSHCTIGGINKYGVGKLYHYDSIGSVESVIACADGKGKKLIQSILDEHTLMNSNSNFWSCFQPDGMTESHARFIEDHTCCNLTVFEAEALVVDAFRAACEREISIGDSIDVAVIHYSDKNVAHKTILQQQIHNTNYSFMVPSQKRNHHCYLLRNSHESTDYNPFVTNAVDFKSTRPAQPSDTIDSSDIDNSDSISFSISNSNGNSNSNANSDGMNDNGNLYGNDNGSDKTIASYRIGKHVSGSQSRKADIGTDIEIDMKRAIESRRMRRSSVFISRRRYSLPKH